MASFPLAGIGQVVLPALPRSTHELPNQLRILLDQLAAGDQDAGVRIEAQVANHQRVDFHTLLLGQQRFGIGVPLDHHIWISDQRSDAAVIRDFLDAIE